MLTKSKRHSAPLGPTEQLPQFIDVFAGCGGLSLGLMQAGWDGLFAIEKDKFAFETLSANLLGTDKRYLFSWPDWLPAKPCSLGSLLNKHAKELSPLSGKLDLLVGGPPCQGFSSAGRRDPNDPRNTLVSDYLTLVKSLRPRIVLIENVRGFTIDFVEKRSTSGRINYSQKIQERLSEDYWVFSRMLDTSLFGVPQERRRFFIIALRRTAWRRAPDDPFVLLEALVPCFLRSKGLNTRIASRSAISDLEISRNGVVASCDTEGFEQIGYVSPDTRYQKLMHSGLQAAPSDLRLARHRPEIEKRFAKIIHICRAQGRLNVSIDPQLRDRFSLKKQALRVLDPDRPAPTITSMPDDLLHYIEPRTLTVRENARLQSFPDWFAFKGKYTTGGDRRRREVPRFTQVANAVPPLLAEALGGMLKALIASRIEIGDAPCGQTLMPKRAARA